ncbi:MAG: DUF3465 domain-containing protein [Psychrobium sp.]|nr:DUF3465 domain-containing protein [Psychrobium sp.]
MRRLFVLLVITLIFLHWSTPAQAASTKSLSQAFANHLSDVQVLDSGTVVRILSDDNKGSRHQRFLLRVSSGQTILIAHNIDLAPKITSIAIGDQVRFYGEYEWNRKGGVVHWTHHDPRARHTGGWLKHKGKTYQ